MNFEDLTPEQQEKAKTCKNQEEILAMAHEEGYELSSDELAAVSGGVSWDCVSDCPNHTPCPQDR